jgi:hypothetical protein
LKERRSKNKIKRSFFFWKIGREELQMSFKHYFSFASFFFFFFFLCKVLKKDVMRIFERLKRGVESGTTLTTMTQRMRMIVKNPKENVIINAKRFHVHQKKILLSY